MIRTHSIVPAGTGRGKTDRDTPHHVAAGSPAAGSDLVEADAANRATRFVFVPAVIASGLSMWEGLAVRRWASRLAAYRRLTPRAQEESRS